MMSQVPEGPAAFKIYLATPAGLAEATLLPELIAVLSRLPCTHAEHVLAVPVNLTLQVPNTDTEQEQQEQQEQEQQQAARRGSISRGQPTAGQAGNHNSSSDSKQPEGSKGGSPPPPAAAGRGLFAADGGKFGSQKGLTWADQRQQEGSSDDCTADFAAATRHSFGGGRRVHADPVQQAASTTGLSAAGKSSLVMHHSRSTPHLGQLEWLLPDTASIEFDSCDEADRFEEQELREQQQQLDSRSAALRPRADSSSSSLPNLLPPHQQRGLSVDSWKADAGIGSDLSTAAAAAGGAAGSTGTDEQRPAVGGLSGILRQQSCTHLSFAAEVHAVLHVRLLLDTETGSSMQPAAAAPCMPAAAATVPAAAGCHISPFALAGALSVLDDSGLPLSSTSALEMQHTALPQTTSILQLGATDPAPPSAAQQQLLQTTAALVAALLCGLALLLPSTGAASILVLCAALANLACMAAALQPVRFSHMARFLQRALRLGHGGHAHAHAHGYLSRSSHAHHHNNSGHHGVKRQHSKRPSATSGQHSARSAAPSRKLQGLRLQLLGGSFVKEALGLLEQQIAAYKDSLESPDSYSGMRQWFEP